MVGFVFLCVSMISIFFFLQGLYVVNFLRDTKLQTVLFIYGEKQAQKILFHGTHSGCVSFSLNFFLQRLDATWN